MLVSTKSYWGQHASVLAATDIIPGMMVEHAVYHGSVFTDFKLSGAALALEVDPAKELEVG